MITFVPISVTIPCRNEEAYIGKCLQSIVDSKYPKEFLSVFVCEGRSTDLSREVIQTFSKSHPWIQCLDNPRQITPAGLNLGFLKGEFPIRVILGGHSEVTPDFFERILNCFYRHPEAACVGGSIEYLHRDEATAAISAVLADPFAMGGSKFREGLFEGWVDTVAFGAYKKEVIEGIGGFDEELPRNQDDDYNFRLHLAGFKIYLDPAIRSRYHVRSSLKKLWSQFFQYGFWKVKLNFKHRSLISLRQIVPFLFVLGILSGGLLAWFSIFNKVYFSVLASYGLFIFYRACTKFKNIKTFLIKYTGYFTVHISYGLGYAAGLIYFLILRKSGQRINIKTER